jgi:hypothetical protein
MVILEGHLIPALESLRKGARSIHKFCALVDCMESLEENGLVQIVPDAEREVLHCSITAAGLEALSWMAIDS